MNLITTLRVRRMATQDARVSLEANLDHVGAAVLGPRPRPPGETEEAVLLEGENTEVRLEALADEIEALERQAVELRPRLLYAIGVVLAFAIESAAAFIVLSALGFAARERLILGLALASATALVATCVAMAERMTRSTFGKWVLRLASGLVFCALVASLAWLRATTGTDELSLIDLVTTALILVAATAAPAILFHLCATGFAQTNSIVLRLRRAVRERVRLERGRGRARDKQVRTERASAAWDSDLQQLRSVYWTKHRQVTAQIAAARAAREERRRDKEARQQAKRRSR